ncbi:DUF5133 domain-containing protein [Streptomyces sp. NPDC005526]|uniref:DUF5133 domain-containing protein n=1 Tax=Streptomyces sp. NPDC005526 TaxID=3156885 RepID=UPI0033B2ACAA
MLMPLPTTLRRLVKEYEALSVQESLTGPGAPSTRLRDLAYTLCVSTGTREVTDALKAARAYLDRTAADSAAPSAQDGLVAERSATRCAPPVA